MPSSESKASRKVVNLNISLISYAEALLEIIRLSRENKPGYVCFANVHMTIEAYNNIKFAKNINNATLVLADGVPIVKALNFFYNYKQERIAGMDIFPDLIEAAEINNLRIFFFGTTPEILERIRVKVTQEFPSLNIAGLFSPPFDKALDDQSYIELINNSKPNLIFVALGCPKQENWMANNFHKINAPLLGVGGAFPVYVGAMKRAPVFMQNLGLEWLYRLAQEPRRLFKRYLITNSTFIYLVIKIKLTSIFLGPKMS